MGYSASAGVFCSILKESAGHREGSQCWGGLGCWGIRVPTNKSFVTLRHINSKAFGILPDANVHIGKGEKPRSRVHKNGTGTRGSMGAEEMTASVTEGGECGWTIGGKKTQFFSP